MRLKLFQHSFVFVHVCFCFGFQSRVLFDFLVCKYISVGCRQNTSLKLHALINPYTPGLFECFQQ